MSLPFQCRDCEKTEAQADMCRIRQVSFATFGNKCPREKGFETTEIVQEEPTDVISLSPEYDKFDTEILEQLKRSKQQQGYLQKVVKDQEGNPISGRHRLKVDPKWPSEIVKVKDELDRELKIIHFNVQRRVPIEETKTRLLRIAQILESHGVPKSDICPNITKLVPYSERHVRRLLPDDYKRGYEQPKPFEYALYNVWNFAGCDDRFGLEGFPGRIPGQIVQNVLYYFIPNKNAKIVDPMAGSGTTKDVCKFMGYTNCLCYDLEPKRDFIKPNDVTDGFPKEAKDANFVFLDPPYFNMVYENLFSDIEDFYRFMEKVATNSYDVLNEQGIVALLMEDMTEKGNYCLSGESYRIFRKNGFETIAHISCPLQTQQFLPQQVEKAKEQKRLLGRNRDLYIFKKNG